MHDIEDEERLVRDGAYCRTHEKRCRIAATMIFTHCFACRMRKCRRAGRCVGPMRLSLAAVDAEFSQGDGNNDFFRFISCIMPNCITLGHGALLAAFKDEMRKRGDRLDPGPGEPRLSFRKVMTGNTWILSKGDDSGPDVSDVGKEDDDDPTPSLDFAL